MCHTLSLHIYLEYLDLPNIKYRTCFDIIICRYNEEEIHWQYHPYLIPHDNHWFSCTDFFHIYRINAGLRYRFYLVRFLTARYFSNYKVSLVVCTFFLKAEGRGGCLIEIFLGDCCRWWFESLPFLIKDCIRLGWSELEGFILPPPVYYCIILKQYWYLILDRYYLAFHAHIHLPLVVNTVCSDSKWCSMPYHQNVCHGNHRRSLGGWGEKKNTRRRNGPWIYATHQNP